MGDAWSYSRAQSAVTRAIRSADCVFAQNTIKYFICEPRITGLIAAVYEFLTLSATIFDCKSYKKYGKMRNMK